jgi:MoxR-like ATPase
MLKLKVDYPDKSEEKEILRKIGFEEGDSVKPVIKTSELEEITNLIREIYVDEKLKDYMVDLVFATRKPQEYVREIAPYIHFGGSPRATICLSLAARVRAFLNGRPYVTPQDIKTVGPDVLRHRIILTYEAEAEDITTDQIIQQVFESVRVP